MRGSLSVSLASASLPVGTRRVSQVPGASLHAYHALRWTPAVPRKPHQSGFSVSASGSLKPSPTALCSLTGLYQALGRAVSLAVYVFPCVRFNCFVRVKSFESSSTVATLGMSGWLDLTQQGLTPCKKRQAALGALTAGFSRARSEAERVGCKPLLGGPLDWQTVPLKNCDVFSE